MKKLRLLFILITFLTLSCITQLKAQYVSVNTSLTMQQLIQDTIMGLCSNSTAVQNISYTGEVGQYGYFSRNNTSFPFQGGLVLATGNVVNVPQNPSSQISNALTSGSDPDLATLSGMTINDACIIQFDFTPNTNNISFDYIFASEEFDDYCNSINDVFGFFLSGPGINGPYSNGAVNIALLPNGQNVTINNICALDNGVTTGTYSAIGTAAPFNSSNVFDRLTYPLTASYPVVAGVTYHLKLAIGDASDRILDSGVFIEAGSMQIVQNATLVNITGTTILTCDTPAIQLQVNGGDNYVWSNGSTSQQITVTSPGTYTVTVTENLCNTVDILSITITEEIVPSININYSSTDVICNGQVTLTGDNLISPNWIGTWSSPTYTGGNCFSNVNSPTTTVTIGQNYGTHQFIWTQTHNTNPNCVESDTVSIVFEQQLDATLVPIDDLCYNSNNFMVGAVNLGELSLTGPTGFTASALNTTTGEFSPTSTIAGTYTIINNFPIAQYNCALPRADTVTFTSYEGISVTNIDINCGPSPLTDPQLHISFDVYTATTNQPMSSQYNINSIAYSTSHYNDPTPNPNYSYVVSDINNCNTIPIEGTRNCGCPWFSGNIIPANTLIYFCEGANAGDSISHDGTQNITPYDPADGMGVFQFIITKNNPYPIGTIIARTNNLNSINATLLGANFQFGVIYYIHPVAGANDGSGNPVLSGTCYSVGSPAQVMWRQNPTVIASDKDTCGKIIQLNGNNVAGSMYGFWTSNGNFSCVSGSINTPNPTVLVDTFGIYTFVWNIVNGSCTATDTCEIYFRHPPTPYAGIDYVTCADTATLYGSQLQIPVSQITWSCVQGGGPSPIPSTNDTTVAHRGMNYGTYIYRITEQLQGCIAYDDAYVNFVEAPNPITTKTADTVCGYQYQLNVSTTSGSSSGQWSAYQVGQGGTLTPFAVTYNPNNQSRTPFVAVPSFSTPTIDVLFVWDETNIQQGLMCQGSASTTVTFIQTTSATIQGDNIASNCGTCITVTANTIGTSIGTNSYWSTAIDGTWSDIYNPTATFCINDSSIYGDTGFANFTVMWNQEISIGNFSCPSTAPISVFLYERPQADAGLDQAVCGMYTDLAAAYDLQPNPRFTPCGLWILPVGFQTTQSPGCDFTNNTASVTAPTYGTYNLIWEERNPNWANCSSKDTVTIEFVQIPVANAGPDQSVCNDSATLAAVMGTAQSGTWATLGGGTILQPNNPNTEVAHTPGTVSYIWTAMNQSSLTTTAIEQCHASDTVVVNFYAPTDAIINTDDTLYCGLSFCSVLRAEPLSDNNQYIGTWACNSSSVQFDQSTIHSATNLCLSVTNPGTYEFYWLTNVVNTATGFCEDRDTFRINFVEAPIVNAGMDTSKCGSSIQLRGHTNYQGSTINIITTWVSTEDLIISNPNNLTTNIDCGTFYGEYEIALVADNNSCTSSDTIRVTFRPFPDAGFDIIPPRCFGEPAIFTARDNSLTNYEWHFNPESPTMRTISHQLFNNNGGNYSNYVEWVVDPQDTLRGDSVIHFVRLNVLDQYGCNGTYDDTVREPAGVEVPPLIIPDTCSLAVGRIQFNPTENHSADYRWLDTVYGDFVNPRIYRNLMGNRDYLAERSYLSQSPYPYHQTYVQLFGTAFCKDTVSYNVGMVGELEALAEISPTIDPNSLIVQGDVIFVNNSQYDNVRKRCEWHFGDGIVLNDCDLTVTHQYAMPGEYQPYLVIYNTDRPACRDTSELLFVLIENQSHLNVPNVFTPNGDGINDYFQVDAESIVEFQGEIRNRWGEKVFEWTDCEAVESGWNGKSAISTDSASGVYYYYIKAKGLDGVEYNLRGFLHLIRGGE